MSDVEPGDGGGDSTLLRLQQQGAGLLPDPEKSLRLKAAAKAADEWQAMSEAFKSAGCVPVYSLEVDES